MARIRTKSGANSVPCPCGDKLSEATLGKVIGPNLEETPLLGMPERMSTCPPTSRARPTA